MTLRFKLNLILITLLVVTNGSVAFLLAEKQKELLSELIHQQAQAITTLISQDAINLMLLDTPDRASDIVVKLQSIKNLAGIDFYNKDDKNILSFSHHNHLHEPKIKHIQQTIPLTYDSVTLGHLDLFFSATMFNKHFTELNYFLIKVFFVLFLLTLLFALFIDRYITKRLSALNKALHDTAMSQNYTLRLPKESQDEIGQAYQNFNELVGNTEALTTTLQKQVYRDNLTGLFNRAYIAQQVQHNLNKHVPFSNVVHALCYLDLDLFKIINDTYGHSVGDQLLKALAQQWQNFSATLPNSHLARLGGDEFALLIENTSPLKVEKITQNLLDIIQQFKFQYLNQSLHIGVSIGVILFNDATHENEALLSAADTACYHAKNRGLGSVSTFWMDSEALRSEKVIMSWFHRIQDAIEQSNFVVYLQPIVPANPPLKQSLTFEALIRLQENQQILAPFQFMPSAERFHLTPEIDFYMVRKVSAHLRDHPGFLAQLNHISINLSGQTLSTVGAAEKIIAILEEAQIPFHQICFEITETSALSNLEDAIVFINKLAQKGCLFSLDDFGTGMSSFDYLYNLPLNYLKIDGSFIKDIIKDPIKREMVIAMQKISNLMQLETVAEFVENQAIVAMLNEIGIHYHQGYHYSEPKPIGEFSQPFSQRY